MLDCRLLRFNGCVLGLCFTKRLVWTTAQLLMASCHRSAGILANLEARISSAEPLAYTYLNTVLVAVNPLKVLTNQPQPTE
jgi:hypothetical protein